MAWSHHRRRGATFTAACLVASLLPFPSLAAPPSAKISINDVAMAEGNSGVKIFTFTVKLAGRKPSNASVRYETGDSTASSPSDYGPATGSLSFASGRQQTVFVSVNGDTVAEPEESFDVNLSDPSGATISDPKGVGTIQDDDPMPSLATSDVTVGEGDSGTTNASFKVTLSRPSAGIVTADFDTSPQSATAPEDYVAASGTLTFDPGEVTKAVDVDVRGDTADEPDESFALDLSSVAGAAVGDGQGVATIIDDEGAPAVSIGDASLTEGNSGTTEAQMDLVLSRSSSEAVTIAYASADGTAEAAADYQTASGTVSFDPGQIAKSVSVAVNGDVFDEPDESLKVSLSAPNNAVIADGSGTATIGDDDAAPSVSVANKAIREGQANKTLSFSVALSSASNRVVRVSYVTSDRTAAAPGDYLTTSAAVTFNPGETKESVAVPVVGDRAVEPGELFFLDVSSTTNADLGDGRGGGTIRDNDTSTTLQARKARRKINARGRLTPSHRGRQMVVTLYKKKGTRFVKVGTKRPTLSGSKDLNGDGLRDSSYRTAFRNPKGTRRCRAIARFPGDKHHVKSGTRKTFSC
jgi:urease beta subunit